MQHLDEGTIHAWIDGELSPEQASEVEAHVRDCASCAAMVAEARGLVAASTRILTALDHVPGGVLPSVPDIAPAQAARRRWYQRTDVRAAAALLFVAGTSLVVVRSRTNMRGTSAMIATADKAPTSLSSPTASETTGSDAASRVQQGMADAMSPRPTAPAEADRSASREILPEKTSATTGSPKTGSELRFGAVAGTRVAEGARNQSLQQKDIADQRAAAGASRDESQLSKEAVTKRRAEEVGNLPPPAARLDAAAPAIAAPPAEVRGANPASLEAMVVTSAATAPLRIVRTDTTSGTKRTVYEVSRGVEVTLTESPAQGADERDYAANDLARQKAAAPQRSEPAREMPQVLSARTGDARPAPPAAPIPPPHNSIAWTDRGKRYTLSGRLTVKELEGIKTRLMQATR